MRRVYPQGFTLIEVMVALLVVGIALPALMAQVLTQLDGSSHLRDRAHARWVAEDQLNLIILQHRFSGAVSASPIAGSRELLGRTWYWQAESLNTGMPAMWMHRVSAGLSSADYLLTIEGLSSDSLLPLNIATGEP